MNCTGIARSAVFVRTLMAAAACLLAAAVHAEVLDQKLRVGRTSVSYQLVLPSRYDAQRTYPGVLGFSGGPQNWQSVQMTVKNFYADEAQRRGYIVVVPAAPDGQLFFEGGERLLPDLLQAVLARYKIEGNTFHVMGPSNGGISAFQVAALYPQYFSSITAFPGYLPQANGARLAAISHMCIHMFVGSQDELDFGTPMQQNLAVFKRHNLQVTYSVEAGQPHRLTQTLGGAHASRLFDQLEQDRARPCTTTAQP